MTETGQRVTKAIIRYPNAMNINPGAEVTHQTAIYFTEA
jgi:hypothetical protein